MREETIGGQRLVLGDCREVLLDIKSETFNAAITDPPYGTNTADWDKDPPSEVWEALKLIAVGGPIAVFGYPETHLRWAAMFAPLLPLRSIAWWHYNHPVSARAMMREWQQIVIWGETMKVLIGGDEIRQPYEAKPHLMRWARGGKGPDPRGKTCSDVWKIATPGASFNSHLRNHPNEKPVEALDRLVRLLIPVSGNVIDPYMGSGTTLVAAELNGRSGLGIEQDATYFEIACRRVEKATSDRAGAKAQLTLTG